MSGSMTKLLRLSRTGRTGTAVVEAPALVLPWASVDGWTLAGTALDTSVPFRLQREACTLLHAVAIGADSPYTYSRAAKLLSSCGEEGQGLAVIDAWAASPASALPRHAAATRMLARQRRRLAARIAARTAAVDAPAGGYEGPARTMSAMSRVA